MNYRYNPPDNPGGRIVNIPRTDYFFPVFEGLLFTGWLAGLACGTGRGVSECLCSTVGRAVVLFESLPTMVLDN